MIIKYFFIPLLPFLLAILLYYFLKPLLNWIEQHCHLSKNMIGMTILMAFYFLILFCLSLLLFYGVFFTIQFIQNLPYLYQSIIEPFFLQMLTWLETQFPVLQHQDYLSYLYEYSPQILIQIMTILSNLFSHIPYIFFFIGLFMMATLFLFLEHEQMKGQIIKHCSLQSQRFLLYLQKHCLQSFFAYVKCQIIMIVICFVILAIVFMILHIQHPLLLAFLVSLLDSLPFIGVGIVLLPLAIQFLLQGSICQAIYIVLVYLLLNFIRSFLEPHIMNKQLKIPSFVLLLSMIIHLYIFGMIGLILSPIHMNILYGLLEYQK